MIRKILITCMMLFAVAYAGRAASHSLTVNGQKVDKTVSSITFDGDSAVLHFQDGSSMSADMETVEISIDMSGIADVETFSLNGWVEGDVLVVEGLEPGVPVEVCNLAGQRVASGVSSEGRSELSLAGQPSGVYILRAGNCIVKFAKR